LNYEVAPFPLNDPLAPTTLEVACVSATHCMRFIIRQILKFMSEHITLLNLVANGYEP